MNWNPANQDQILLQKFLLQMGEGSKILNGVLEVRKHVEDGKRRLVLHICEHRPVKKKLLPAPCSRESEGEAPTWPSVGSSPEPGLWGTEGAWQKHWWNWTGGEDAANADTKLGGQSNALRLELSRKGPAVAVGRRHWLCHAWRLESRAVHQPGVKAGEEEEEKREAGGPCTCPLPRQVGFRNRAPLTRTI